jgi:hypothetical protein
LVMFDWTVIVQDLGHPSVVLEAGTVYCRICSSLWHLPEQQSTAFSLCCYQLLY